MMSQAFSLIFIPLKKLVKILFGLRCDGHGVYHRNSGIRGTPYSFKFKLKYN